MDYYDLTVPVFSRTLHNMEGWLAKAVAHGELRRFDADTLLTARLAPDQFAFARQVQGACDNAKFASAKLAGKEAPSTPDTEKTIDELRARIRWTISFLEGFRREDFAGAAERQCSAGWMRGRWLSGDDYLRMYALPNFFFHATTAYAILRHNGVDVGKTDFLGPLPFQG